MIQQKILELPPKYRSVIVLKCIQDLSIKEVHKTLHIPMATVKTKVRRGREALRHQLRYVLKKGDRS